MGRRRRVKNETLELVLEEIRAVGLEPRVEHRDHIKVWFEHRGRKYLYAMAATPSDRRNQLNCRSGVRRLIRYALSQ